MIVTIDRYLASRSLDTTTITTMEAMITAVNQTTKFLAMVILQINLVKIADTAITTVI